jgi:hypothetical protein
MTSVNEQSKLSNKSVPQGESRKPPSEVSPRAPQPLSHKEFSRLLAEELATNLNRNVMRETGK